MPVKPTTRCGMFGLKATALMSSLPRTHLVHPGDMSVAVPGDALDPPVVVDPLPAVVLPAAPQALHLVVTR